jgi:hypothetical protein
LINVSAAFCLTVGGDDEEWIKNTKETMDAEAGKCGLGAIEELLFAKLMDEIGATDEKGNKVLAYLHFCETLNGNRCHWIGRLPTRFTTIKRQIQKSLKKVNADSDVRTGTNVMVACGCAFSCSLRSTKLLTGRFTYVLFIRSQYRTTEETGSNIY